MEGDGVDGASKQSVPEFREPKRMKRNAPGPISGAIGDSIKDAHLLLDNIPGVFDRICQNVARPPDACCDIFDREICRNESIAVLGLRKFVSSFGEKQNSVFLIETKNPDVDLLLYLYHIGKVSFQDFFAVDAKALTLCWLDELRFHTFCSFVSDKSRPLFVSALLKESPSVLQNAVIEYFLRTRFHFSLLLAVTPSILKDVRHAPWMNRVSICLNLERSASCPPFDFSIDFRAYANWLKHRPMCGSPPKFLFFDVRESCTRARIEYCPDCVEQPGSAIGQYSGALINRTGVFDEIRTAEAFLDVLNLEKEFMVVSNFHRVFAVEDVGFATFYGSRKGSIARLASLFVRPSERQKGWARRLLSGAEEVLNKEGCRMIWVNGWSHEVVHDVLLRLGFKDDGNDRNGLEISSSHQESLHVMKKTLLGAPKD